MDKIPLRLDKKRFLERNESAFMIPKKFEYLPIRRDETELVQKPVLEVHDLLLSSLFSHFLLSFIFLSFLLGLELLVKRIAGLYDFFSNCTIPSPFSHLLCFLFFPHFLGLDSRPQGWFERSVGVLYN